MKNTSGAVRERPHSTGGRQQPAQGRTLILLGHGSHLNADSASAVRAHADAVRRRGLFEQVIEGYWKDEPGLRRLLGLAQFRDVTVAPLFVSHGYFTGQVIPRELGLGAASDQAQTEYGSAVTEEAVAGRRVRYLPPYGVHSAMSGVILARAQEVRGQWTPARTALVVLGHGTGRDQRSAQAIEAAADRLRAGGHFAEVAALYLDQEPNVQDWPQLTRAPEVIIVPFFASEGWHTQETIPEELGLSGPHTQVQTDSGLRDVFYARPVGTHPAVTEVILQLLEEASAHGAGAAQHQGGAVHPAWQRAGDLLAGALAGGELMVGDVQISRQPDGYLLRHRADARAAAHAATRSVPLAELSAWTGRTGSGEHRPIRTLRDLRRGWQITVPDTAGVRAALQAIYPGVLEDCAEWDRGTLQVTSWTETAARQTGIYRRVRQASAEQVGAARAEVCGRCLRTPLWASEVCSPSPLYAPSLGCGAALPCPEACTLLVSAVRGQLTQTTGPTVGTEAPISPALLTTKPLEASHV